MIRVNNEQRNIIDNIDSSNNINQYLNIKIDNLGSCSCSRANLCGKTNFVLERQGFFFHNELWKTEGLSTMGTNKKNQQNL